MVMKSSTPQSTWIESEKKTFTVNAYNKVFLCQFTQEIWLLLEVTHVCTNQVQGLRLVILFIN